MKQDVQLLHGDISQKQVSVTSHSATTDNVFARCRPTSISSKVDQPRAIIFFGKHVACKRVLHAGENRVLLYFVALFDSVNLPHSLVLLGVRIDTMLLILPQRELTLQGFRDGKFKCVPRSPCASKRPMCLCKSDVLSPIHVVVQMRYIAYYACLRAILILHILRETDCRILIRFKICLASVAAHLPQTCALAHALGNRCLIATNVAARGLDIPEVDLVLQCEPPRYRFCSHHGRCVL